MKWALIQWGFLIFAWLVFVGLYQFIFNAPEWGAEVGASITITIIAAKDNR